MLGMVRSHSIQKLIVVTGQTLVLLSFLVFAAGLILAIS
jgi:hypothetical protein